MSQNKPIGAKEYRRVVAQMCAEEKAKIVVEVGVFAGGLTRVLAEIPTIEELHVVDPWDVTKSPYRSQGRQYTQPEMDAVFAEIAALKRQHKKIVIHRQLSAEAARFWPSSNIEFWHCDGNHDYKMVCLDIVSWKPHVASGCLMTGDNYECEGVRMAVDELLPDREILGKGRVWAWRVP